jgi:hypothetical protein
MLKTSSSVRPRSVLAAGMYAPIFEILLHCQLGKHLASLRDVRDSEGGDHIRRQRGDVSAEEVDGAGCQPHEARDRAKGGAFTRSVGAQQANRLALADASTDIADRRNGSVGGANTRERQHAPSPGVATCA